MIQHPLLHTGTKMVVMGLGVSGKSAIRYGLACGASVYLSDVRNTEQIDKDLRDIEGSGRVIVEAGGHTEAFLEQADVLFVSPGVSCTELLLRMSDKGKRIMGELALVADVIDIPIVAITGTNGKTTVTSLVGELLRAAGKRVFVGGNIGTPLLDWLLSGEEVDCLVAEVSSFQLEYAGNFRPSIAILLNITPDHLDRHGDLASYRQAKMNLFAHQTSEDLAIINGDDALIDFDSNTNLAKCITFGEHPGCDVVASENGVSLTFQGTEERYSLEGTELGNRTGCLNSAPSIYAARTLGCSAQEVIKGLHAFKVGEHRMELVGTVGGVEYYNDSKATNTGAVLSGLKQVNQVVLIAGGRDKGDDYTLLREAVQEKVVHLITIGEAASLIETALDGYVEVTRAHNLSEAVHIAHLLAKPGQCVLLSPACASFDMFTSYKARGECFRDEVRELQIRTEEL